MRFRSDWGSSECQSFHRAVLEHRLIALCEGGFRFQRPKAELRSHEQWERAVKWTESDASSFAIVSCGGLFLCMELLRWLSSTYFRDPSGKAARLTFKPFRSQDVPGCASPHEPCAALFQWRTHYTFK